MRELAETFNDMLTRLERAFEAQRRFSANASHELRGPVTTQRALVDVAAASPDAEPGVKALADALRPQLDRQQRLIEGLLALASSEHGATETVPADLADLTRECLTGTAAEINAGGLDLDTRLDPAPLSGDPVLLDLLVTNLVRNAVQHNVVGGRIWVRTGPGLLTVANTGPEISAERLRELLEPFRRGHRDRLGTATTGVGLGLAIVQAAATAHGARLTVLSRPGGGVRAIVEFPTEPPSAGGKVGPPSLPGVDIEFR
jgi:signal transduction histidine kinase